MMTDISPGFASAALFLNIAIRQLCLDLRSMCSDSTKIFIIETMGRHAGWLTASAGLSHSADFPGPQVLLVPEKKQNLSSLLAKIEDCVQKDGYCCIAISEGYSLLAPSQINDTDAFGNPTLQGSGAQLKRVLGEHLSYKIRLCIPDSLQRSFALLRSEQDALQSFELGQKAILELNNHGLSGHMLTVKRVLSHWEYSSTPLSQVALFEKKLPLTYLSPDGWTLSDEGRNYMEWAIGPQIKDLFDLFWPHYLTTHSMRLGSE